MKHPLIDKKFLIVDWSPGNVKYRKFKFRHHKSVKGFYVQILALEVATWYGDTSATFTYRDLLTDAARHYRNRQKWLARKERLLGTYKPKHKR